MNDTNGLKYWDEDISPEDIIAAEVRESLKTIRDTRDGKLESELRLRAAKYLLDKFLPDRTHQQIDSNIQYEVTVKVVHERNERLEHPEGLAIESIN